MPVVENGRARRSGSRAGDSRASAHDFDHRLRDYREETARAVLEAIPRDGPPYLYELVASYPRRPWKGLRPALCLATCCALGGHRELALNTAVAIELFHTAFLAYDDVQDESLARRGGATLHREHGVGIAVNVANATSLLALQQLIANRQIVGPERSGFIIQETEEMMRHTLEGQAIELAWIRDNACDLEPKDYLQMCLKKTSWYSFIYPLRVGAVVAQGRQLPRRFLWFGWYLGAAFQIQDDILNLAGDFSKYGKEIGGDLREGKRTLMLTHLLKVSKPAARRRLVAFLARSAADRTPQEMLWVHEQMVAQGSMAFAAKAARQLAGAALLEGLAAFRDVPDSTHRQFILDMVRYVVERDC
jgi:geranylgeranyl diphosphate synthase, type II